MPGDTLTVYRNHLTGDGARDTAISRAILQRVSAHELPEILEVGTPHRVMAFGKHDTLTTGFREAVDIAVEAGYDPTVRIAGGRAVVFGPSIIRFAWTMEAPDPATTMHERFAALADAFVATMAAVDVAAVVGELPGEYCAGRYSVHIPAHGGRPAKKVMGVGQRLTRSGAQVGGMIVVSDPDDINSVLEPVYDALGVPIDPTATGSIADAAAVAVPAIVDAFVARIADGRDVVDAHPDETTASRAESLRSDHVATGLA